MKLDYHKIGNRLVLARRKIGLSQEEVSLKVGISKDYYAHIESGCSCSLDVFIRMLTVLNITSDYAFADVLPTAKHILLSEYNDVLNQCTNDQIATLKSVAEAFVKANRK